MTNKNIITKRIVPLLFITAFALSGCVVTERQIETEQSLKELNTLAAKLQIENKALRISTEDNTRALGEISADMDTLHQDFATMRGGFESRENALQSVEANFDLLSDAISALDERMKDIDVLKERLLVVENPLANDEVKTNLDNTLLELRLSIEEIKRAALEYQIKEKETTIEESRTKKDDKKDAKKSEEKGPDPENLYLEGLEAVKVDKDYVKGLETLRLFLKLYPDHELADNAQYWIAEAHYDRGEWDRAAIEFNQVVKKYPKADKVPAALLKQGFSFEKMMDKETSSMILNKLIKKYPKSNEAKSAKEHLNKDKKKKTKTKATNKDTTKKPSSKEAPKDAKPPVKSDDKTTSTETAPAKTD
ncbi:MAG: tol-pal system protein YbgF [Deltaproteobacteria bacterium]|nr:tol-pal system protein YbgF [Deltaproteobacteria bacterium]